jgi:hypothetical protein
MAQLYAKSGVAACQRVGILHISPQNALLAASEAEILRASGVAKLTGHRRAMGDWRTFVMFGTG